MLTIHKLVHIVVNARTWRLVYDKVGCGKKHVVKQTWGILNEDHWPEIAYVYHSLDVELPAEPPFLVLDEVPAVIEIDSHLSLGGLKISC